MKSASAGLASHLAQDVTTLATCIRLTRKDGTEFFFTDHDRDLVISGDTYKSDVAYQRSPIASNDQLSVDNLEVTGILDDASITQVDLRGGKFDYAVVEVFLVNWADLTQGILKLRRGRLGEVIVSPKGTFQTELRGLAQAFSRTIVELRSPECRADLGDARCKIPIDPPAVQRSTAYVLGSLGNPVFVAAGIDNRIHELTTAGTTAASAPSYNSTVGGTTTDGTATFTTREAWTRVATVTAVVDRANFSVSVDEDRDVTGWFDGGLLSWTSGLNQGTSMEVKGWTKTDVDEGTIQLFLKMPFDVAIGDALVIHPGCFKRRDEDCLGKFANVINFRGEPDLPGRDAFLEVARAR